MLDSIAWARFLGLILTVLGLGIALNPKNIRAAVEDIISSRALQLFAAISPTLLGSLIVATHNNWEHSWALSITVLGWLMVLGGAFRSCTPNIWIALTKKWVNKFSFSISGSLIAAIGVFFLYHGFRMS